MKICLKRNKNNNFKKWAQEMKPRNGKIRKRNETKKCDQEMKITIKRNENRSFKKWAQEMKPRNEKITKRNGTKK